MTPHLKALLMEAEHGLSLARIEAEKMAKRGTSGYSSATFWGEVATLLVARDNTVANRFPGTPHRLGHAPD